MKLTPINQSKLAQQFAASQSTNIIINSWEDWQSFLAGFNPDWLNSSAVDLATIHTYFPSVSMASMERMLASMRNTTSADYTHQIDNEVMLSLVYVVSTASQIKEI